jgi:CRISPR-associated Csx2 family protein
MWDNIAEYFDSDEEYILRILEDKENKSLSEQDLKKLNNLIDNKLQSKDSKCYIIKDGENEDELWSVFEKFLDILENIKNDDEVYFDITHLFRSVSVMSLVMAEFGKTYKNYKIAGLFYGMLKKNEPSLIINVAMFFELLEWAKAIEEIENFASFDRFVRLSQDKIEKNGYDKLVNLKNSFNIANMTAIYNSINQLKTHLKYFSENKNKIIRLITPRFEQFIKRFSKNSLSEFQFELAKFFSEKNNFALAYIALAEAIITNLCETKGLDANKKEDRQSIKDELYDIFKNNKLPKEKKKKNLL